VWLDLSTMAVRCLPLLERSAVGHLAFRLIFFLNLPWRHSLMDAAITFQCFFSQAATGSKPILIYQQQEEKSIGPIKWPIARPPGSFAEFYVQPMTHLVNAAHNPCEHLYGPTACFESLRYSSIEMP